MDMESRRDGCGVYEVGRSLLDVPERQLTRGPRGHRFIADIRTLTTVEPSRRGVRRCLAGTSATPVHSASVGGGV